MPFITIIIFGILTSCFALVIELIVTGLTPISLVILTTLSPSVAFIIFLLAGIEEISKYVFLHQYALRYLKQDTSITIGNIWLYGIAFGLGFSLLETGLSIYGDASPVLLATLGRTAIHSITSILFAFVVFRPSISAMPLRIIGSLAFAISIHFAYNSFSLIF